MSTLVGALFNAIANIIWRSENDWTWDAQKSKFRNSIKTLIAICIILLLVILTLRWLS